jgi:hypothetical protein
MILRTPSARRAVTVAAGIALLGLVVGACGGDGDSSTGGTTTTRTAAGGESPVPVIDPGDGGDYRPDLDPADIVDRIDNPYLPLSPGSSWVYEATADSETERIQVVVTSDRREVMDIPAVVVRDTVTVDGQLVEDTFDWFAQDRDGNVWYLGEDSTEYEDGRPASTAGSWEAGVDGAQPGIVMPAEPAPGQAYRQEYLVGEAEDMAEVARVGVTETVPVGSFDDLLVTTEWTPLEPETVEEKYYAPGVGLVLEVVTAGGEGRVELIEHTPGG